MSEIPREIYHTTMENSRNRRPAAVSCQFPKDGKFSEEQYDIVVQQAHDEGFKQGIKSVHHSLAILQEQLDSLRELLKQEQRKNYEKEKIIQDLRDKSTTTWPTTQRPDLSQLPHSECR